MYLVFHTSLPGPPVIQYTDASNARLGVVLAQITLKGEKLIFLSHKLSQAEQKYSAIEKEELAVAVPWRNASITWGSLIYSDN